MELAKWCDLTRALALAERACDCEQHLSPDECTGVARRRERLEGKLSSRKTAR